MTDKNTLTPEHTPPKRKMPEGRRFRKGDPLRPKGGRKTLVGEMNKLLSETVTRPDGSVVTQRRALAEILLGKIVRGPTSEPNDPNWRFVVDEVLKRISPVPREGIVSMIQQNVVAEQHNESMTFVDLVRAETGHDDVTPDDVLTVLRRKCFGAPGGGNGRGVLPGGETAAGTES